MNNEDSKTYTTTVDVDEICKRELFRRALVSGSEDYLQEKMSHADMVELTVALMKRLAAATHGYSRGLVLRALHETEELIMQDIHKNTCAEIESYWYEREE